MYVINELAKKLEPILKSQYTSKLSECRLFASFSDMLSQAVVVNASANTLDEAWKKLEFLMYAECIKRGISPNILKIDWVINKRQLTFYELTYLLNSCSRGYFRYGVSFDLNYNIAFLESEINSNMMFYHDDVGNVYYNPAESNNYCRQRFDTLLPPIDNTTLVEIFETNSIFVTNEDHVKLCTSNDSWTGIRDLVNKTNEQLLKQTLFKTFDFLYSRMKPCCGKFEYCYYAGSNEVVEGYNLFDHFCTILCLLSVDEIYHREHLEISDKALSLINSVIDKYLKNYITGMYFVDNGIISIDCNALAVLVLNKYKKIYNSRLFDNQLKYLINGIIKAQQPDGSFIHQFNNHLETYNKFVHIRYNSVCIYALLEMYESTADQLYLDRARKGLRYWIENSSKYLQYRDHWITYCIKKIIKYDNAYQYYKLIYDNIFDYFDFIKEQKSIQNGLLELIINSSIIFNKMKDIYPELYSKIDIDKFITIYQHRAAYELTAFGWPEISMYFKHPDLILNSFFNRDNNFRIRLDDLYHNITGLLLYLNRDFYEKL